MLHRCLLASALAALALVAQFPDALACSPPLPGVYASIPKDGASYPANAKLFFEGYDISLDGVSVTVGGLPATLSPAGASGSLGLSATISPQPNAGDVVVIDGTFCPPDYGCPSWKVTFTATAPDVTPPAETMPVGYDIYDYTDYKSSGGDCTSDSDLAYWVELKAPAPDPAGSPVIYTLEAYRGESLDNLAFSRTGFLSETGQAKIELRLSAQELGGKSAPEAFCFHVETTDAAGNPAPVTSESPVFVCKPCNFRVSDAPNAGFGPPPEPMWNSGDSYPGGPCDPGGGTGGSFPDGGLTTGSGGSGGGGGGEDVVIGGCGCRVGGEGEGAGASLAGLALLASAALRAKRRRARR